MYDLERPHRLCLKCIVPNSLVKHIPRADDVVSSDDFFPLCNERTRTNVRFKDRAVYSLPPSVSLGVSC